jgi:hypothetical protein
MENKKWWFVILLLITIAVIAGVAAYDAGFKNMVVGGLSGTLGVLYTSMAAGWAQLGLMVGASGLNFLIGAVAFSIVGFLLGTLLWRRAVPKAKQVLGMTASKPFVISGSTSGTEPRDVVITEAPAKTKTEEEKVSA